MTKQEKRIAAELAIVLVLFILIVHLATINWETAGKYASIFTPTIALGAAIVAWRAIAAQRDIARRRAAIDFFLKTETDRNLIDLYTKFKSRMTGMVQLSKDPNFHQDKDYNDLRAFLNICELIAVGVREKAFSNRVSFAYWGDVLPATYYSALPLIEVIRKTAGEGTEHTYSDLAWLCNDWEINPPGPSSE
jgi:hypothetical protein